jgi:hypothetical protein
MSTIPGRCILGMVTAFVVIHANAGVALAAENKMHQVADIGDRRQLFVDSRLIERMDRLSLRLHEPVSGGIAIKLDKPWEGPANGGYSVLRCGDSYLMYYRAMTLQKDDDTGALCVATSNDGVTWTKPALGLVERAGRWDTNIAASESGKPLRATPWFDARSGVPANERIKALHSEPISGEKHTAYVDPKGPKRLVMWVSADGFTFRKLVPQPKIVSNLRNCFDGGNTMFWSEVEQAYVLYYRFWDSKRTVARTTSKDFFNWSAPVPMTYGDTPREHLYTNNTEPYFRAPHLYIALAARFMQSRRVVTQAQSQAIGLKSSHGHSYANDCSDGVLLTTQAGSSRYDRTFMEALVRPGPGARNWVSRTNYPLTGIFPCGKERIMFWVSRHYMQETWHIERLLLRLDGFASVNAPYAGGEMVTKPLIFDGEELEINYRTSAAGGVRIEIQDAAGKPITDYALNNCQEIIGDDVASVVAWKHGTNISQLAGRLIRLRFLLKDADLYSFKFRRNELALQNKPNVGNDK